MSEMKLSNEELIQIAFFEHLSKAKVRDCINEADRVIFVVEKGQTWIAIGKNAANLKEAYRHFKKSIEIIEYSENKEEFIKSIFHNYKVDVKIDDTNEKTVALIFAQDMDRGKVIGKNGRNIKMAKMLAGRHHDIDDVRVVSEANKRGF
jgi:N utilization substance protein A